MDPSATPPPDDEKVLRDRTSRLFEFVAALHRLRNPVPKSIENWKLHLAELPDYETVTITKPVVGSIQDDNDEDEPATLLRCARPLRTKPPEPPAILSGWLTRDWEDSANDPQVVASQNVMGEHGETIIVRFVDSEARSEALTAYRNKWDQWASGDRVAGEAQDVFEKLYTLYGQLERDGERLELGIASGTLLWKRSDGVVRYPLLFLPVQLRFEAEIPEFRIVEYGSKSDFNIALLQTVDDVEGRTIANLLSEFTKLDPHPMNESESEPFLRRVASSLSSKGEYFRDASSVAATTEPVIIYDPLFFLRPRTTGVSRAIDLVARDAAESGEIPVAIRNIVGLWADSSRSDSESESNGRAASSIDANEDSQILFTKPANAEQLEIAKLLARDQCVLVQGPPGTGKTHTIGNLIGHLLAEGQTVLVVSHTTKALKVLRDKVVEELRPLCVSVLDSAEDDKTLKASIEAIAHRSTVVDERSLEIEANALAQERERLLQDVRNLRGAILEARLSETRALVVGGAAYSPIDAARAVSDGIGKHDWIPGPVTLGEPLPLSESECVELYASNLNVSKESENALTEVLPDLSAVPDPNEFDRLLNEERSLGEMDLKLGARFWKERSEDAIAIEQCLSNVEAAVAEIGGRDPWVSTIVIAGMQDDASKASWEALLSLSKEVSTAARESIESSLSFQPQLAGSLDVVRAVEIYSDIASETERTGRAPGFLQIATRRDWKHALEGCSVEGGLKPKTAAHFRALAQAAHLRKLRSDLSRRWNAQVAAIGGPRSEGETIPSEVFAEQFRALISTSLSWYRESWVPAIDRFRAIGFDYEEYNLDIQTRFVDADELERLRRLTESLSAICASEYARRRVRFIERRFHEAETIMSSWSAAPAAMALRGAFQDRRNGTYRERYAYILELAGTLGAARNRLALLQRLKRTAFAWATEIRNRVGAHAELRPPGDLAAAWHWRQFSDELDRRDRLSLPEVSRRLASRRAELNDLTARLADRRAWLAQMKRTTQPQHSALQAFVLAKKKIGKGTGKLASRHTESARRSLSAASGAVPVWIMPVVRAAEMFDPRKIKFDVVIVDEASQSDITGLLPLYLGRRVIVVGDNEQVSPSAVGIAIEPVQKLIAMHLQDIPNGKLFDLRSSLYDLANLHFKAKTQLLEHFRCVPEIIRFSNSLSYQGKIRSLREATPDCPPPAVVCHRVASAGSFNQMNTDEAKVVAALAAACMEQPEYAHKTFGVISLNGNYQAPAIESYLRRLVPVEEIERRRLLVGNAAQFQGDERHVMFLSMVDAGRDGVHALREDEATRQRYNVAASRAQDQMWVVHSLDPARDLKVGDLRRQLIEFAMNPDILELNKADALRKSESPFESSVIDRLSAAGYRVTSQQRVGAYRIDIVVEGTNRRLAVECDGERFHQDIQSDMERQAVLERVGWTFERIRGSLFYRDADRAMRPVFDRLRRMGIEPHDSDQFAEQATDGELLARVRMRASELVSSITDDADSQAIQRSSSRSKSAYAEARRRQPAFGLEAPVEESVRDKSEYMDAQPSRLAHPEHAATSPQRVLDEPPKDVASRSPISNGSKPFAGEVPGLEEIRQALSELTVPSISSLGRDELYALVRAKLIGESSLRKSQRLEFDNAFNSALGSIGNDR
jgi:very-short-patch-repair endonuclease